jgi:uncharacterized membrane protein YfcA
MSWLLPAGYEGHPAVYVAVAVLAFLLTGVSKAGFGGVGILAIPLMMMVSPGKLALGMWLPLLILCDVLTIRAYPKEWSLRPILRLAPWMVAGVGTGYLLLGHISDRQVKLFVGSLAVGFVGLEIVRSVVARRVERTQTAEPWRPTWLTAAPFGLAGGVSTMIAHAAGAITTIYLLPQRLGKRSFVGTSARFYFVFNSFKVPFFAHPSLGLINRESLVKSLWLVPLAPLGVWLGSVLNRRLSVGGFNRVIYVLLAISGVYLIYTNVRGVGG